MPTYNLPPRLGSVLGHEHQLAMAGPRPMPPSGAEIDGSVKPPRAPMSASSHTMLAAHHHRLMRHYAGMGFPQAKTMAKAHESLAAGHAALAAGLGASEPSGAAQEEAL